MKENMTQEERMDYLIERLKSESIQYEDIRKDIQIEQTERPMLLRSLMNVRMPQFIDNDYLRIQAEYLKEETQKKGIVTLNDIPTIRKQYKSRHRFGSKISIWQGDITRLKVDAIVNAANSQMLGCFIPCHRCIDNAIHSAAGIELREECHALMRNKRARYGKDFNEPTGQAEITGGYNLPAKHVIHTVGPIVAHKPSHAQCEQLRSCYLSVLECAMANGVRSIAFCCISTGEFHFPNDAAAKIAVESVDEVLKKFSYFFDRIIFNVFKDIDLECYITNLCE